jgi:hypothetical protein
MPRIAKLHTISRRPDEELRKEQIQENEWDQDLRQQTTPEKRTGRGVV